ncbi:MAG: hypothetical protein Q9220_004713 [cf. Caloplaca sp. 1 TL-2023]
MSAIDTLQISTTQALAHNPETPDEALSRPPASRRAASTGGIGVSGHSSRTTSRSPSQSRWEPGMPLPPPPPGPPPTATRSQSLNRTSDFISADHLSAAASRPRRPPGNGTALAPVPPTPADWREEQANSSSPAVPPSTTKSSAQAPLHIDTRSIVHQDPLPTDDASTAISSYPQSAHLRRDSSCGALSRSPAVRNRSAKGIRERRSESRTGTNRTTSGSTDIHSSTITVSPEDLGSIRPTDLVLPTVGASLSRRRTGNRITPTSGRSVLSLDETLRNPLSSDLSGPSLSFPSSNTTPQPRSTQSDNSGRAVAPLVPFSPARVTFAPTERSQNLASQRPRLPSITPLRQSSDIHASSSLNVLHSPDERPISHLLHIPNADESIQEPLLPSSQKKRASAVDLLGPESPHAFARRAIERHRNFAEREAAASSDSERLDLFVQFMLAESRIRREQYAAVFVEEEIEISELAEGLFERQMNIRVAGRNSDAIEPTKPASAHDSGRSSMSGSVSESNWQHNSSTTSRTHESPISMTTDSSSQNRPESSWWNEYIPCLSPIASMSIATGQDHDEIGSRGRASSRWWEDKSGESANGDGFSVLKKSKRESKYMGLPKEARDSPALFAPTSSGPSDQPLSQFEEMSRYTAHGPNEYPPEKVGWHQHPSPLPPPPPHPPTPLSAPYTPDPRKLDISRFVTLPPPYPRHHPAVNNGHPDLADVRAVVRSLLDTNQVDSIRAAYTSQISEKRQRANSWRQHQQSLHDQDMRFRLDHEEISQTELDQAESNFTSKLNKSETDSIQADFDLFQVTVVSPLHSLFAERIATANSSIEGLSGSLFSDAQKQSPNAAQEEGDEQPELLEKLTQLKWLFETRESMHRRTYDLLSERNDKYRAIVLLPYQQSKKHDKYTEAQSFFASDAQDRKANFEHEVSLRFDAFLTVVEANVTRGVEIQLSAFWDIAPPLHRVLTRVPDDLHGFEVQIPADEYVENPEYYDYPLQYLFSLLAHAQKSTYQFIESQVNLLCLLHEIKSAAMKARYQAEDSRGLFGPRKVDEGRRREEARLTEDLKEKVGVIEGQWQEALGEELMAVRERVRCWLLENGGWDDENDEV